MNGKQWKVLVAVLFVSEVHSKDKNDKCMHCRFLTETFNEGLVKTANKHFAGGDTAWEEKNLGKYKTSETRLVEVMEGVCKKKTLQNTDKYSGVKELEFKCSVILEDNEELVEKWYKSQVDDLFASLCINSLRLCCPDGTWGDSCSSCPGLDKGAAVCFGHGECSGAGSRGGTGKCKCSTGYTGHACSHCDANYFPVTKTDSSIECSKCDESCAGGCSGPSNKDCVKCASGWLRDEEEGCLDIDECKAEGSNERCTGAYEICVNTRGSFHCDCDSGYVRGKDGSCEVDVVAHPVSRWLTPPVVLRLSAYLGLFLVVTLIVSFHPSLLCIIFTIIALLASILIELYINPDSIPDAAKAILGGL